MKNYRQVAAIIVSREDKFLLVRKPRKDHAWQFPQGGVDAGESLQKAAMRELSEECGTELKVKLLSEKSVGKYKYLFPKGFVRACDGKPPRHDGAEVFFFTAEYISGEPKADGIELVDTRWCNLEKIEKLVDSTYWRVVESFLGKIS